MTKYISVGKVGQEEAPQQLKRVSIEIVSFMELK